MDSNLLTRKEVAAVLGVTIQKVYSLTREGKLTATRLGHRTVRYSRDAVDALVKAGEAGEEPEEVDGKSDA